MGGGGSGAHAIVTEWVDSKGGITVTKGKNEETATPTFGFGFPPLRKQSRPLLEALNPKIPA